MNLSLFRALRVRPFALMWSGQTISRLGDGLFTVALSWWVLEQTNSPAQMGLVQIFRLIPALTFLLIGGVMADRLPRLQVMFASDVLRGVLVAVVAFLTALHALQVWHIYVVSLVFGFVDAFFQPAYAAVIPDVVPEADLSSANSLTALSGQFSGILGTSIGGLIVAIGGSSAAFALDAVSFFVAMGCVLPILNLVLAPLHTDEQRPNALQDLREGLATVFGIPWLWITILLAAFANMFISSAFSISTPFFVRDNLHADSSAFGLILTMFSVGSIVGAIAIGSLRKIQHRGPVTYAFWIGASLIVALVGITQTVGVVMALTFLTGIGFSAGQLIWINLEQELIPKHLLGRVSSFDQFGSFALMPVGYGLIGWATGQFGAPVIYTVGGILAAVAMSLGLISRSVRTLK